jgi:hypothetical protein
MLADLQQAEREALALQKPPSPPPPPPPSLPPPPVPAEQEPDEQQKQRLDWLLVLQSQRLELEEKCHGLETQLRHKEEDALVGLERNRCS